MEIERYAQRLLNPYRGVMHTIRYGSAEAVTLDGVHWDIYVSNDALLEGLPTNRWTQITDIRYGRWSQAQGLKRGPIYPSADFLRMEAMGAVVFGQLTHLHREVPFPLADAYELWLLDGERRPLALLASALRAEDVQLDDPLAWRAGYAAAEHFASDAVSSAREATEPVADYLSRYVNCRAGAQPVAQWFQRAADGSGHGLVCLGADIAFAEALRGRQLDAREFPALLLADTGHDAEHGALIRDFHTWQAPWLLALPGLSGTLRERLEREARRQAALVEKYHRLYPEVLDPSGIKAALVEALLCRAQAEAPSKDNSLAAVYIELDANPRGTA